MTEYRPVVPGTYPPPREGVVVIKTEITPEDFFEKFSTGNTQGAPAKEYIKMYLQMVLEKILDANPPAHTDEHFAYPVVTLSHTNSLPNIIVEIGYKTEGLSIEKLDYSTFEQAVKCDFEARKGESNPAETTNKSEVKP